MDAIIVAQNSFAGSRSVNQLTQTYSNGNNRPYGAFDKSSTLKRLGGNFTTTGIWYNRVAKTGQKVRKVFYCYYIHRYILYTLHMRVHSICNGYKLVLSFILFSIILSISHNHIVTWCRIHGCWRTVHK